MATSMRRTNVYLTETDLEDAAFIQDYSGLRSLSSAIRVALRKTARQLREDAQRRSRRAAEAERQGGAG